MSSRDLRDFREECRLTMCSGYEDIDQSLLTAQIAELAIRQKHIDLLMMVMIASVAHESLCEDLNNCEDADEIIETIDNYERG